MSNLDLKAYLIDVTKNVHNWLHSNCIKCAAYNGQLVTTMTQIHWMDIRNASLVPVLIGKNTVIDQKGLKQDKSE